MKRIVIFLLLFPLCLFAQDYESDSLDDLFSNPDEDIAVENIEVENVMSALDSTDLYTVSGNFGGTAGFGFGLVETEKFFENENADFFIGASAESLLNVRINPDPKVVIEASLEADIDETTIGNPWSNIELSDFFLEYNVLDTAFVSFGKFSTSIGDDFIDVDTGTSFLLTLPTVLSGVNFLANADESTIVTNADSEIEFDYSKLLVASWMDIVIKSTRLTAGIEYQKHDASVAKDRFAFLLAAQSNVFNANVFSEIQYDTYEGDFLSGNAGAYYVSNTIYLAGKYTVDSYSMQTKTLEHSVELGFRLPSLFDSKWNFDLASKYQINSQSGFLIPILHMSPLKYVTLSFAMPYIFGDAGFSVYDDFLDGEYSITLPTELSLLCSVSVKVPF